MRLIRKYNHCVRADLVSARKFDVALILLSHVGATLRGRPYICAIFNVNLSSRDDCHRPLHITTTDATSKSTACRGRHALHTYAIDDNKKSGCAAFYLFICFICITEWTLAYIFRCNDRSLYIFRSLSWQDYFRVRVPVTDIP